MQNIIYLDYGNKEVKIISLDEECIIKRLNSKLVNNYLDKNNK